MRLAAVLVLVACCSRTRSTGPAPPSAPVYAQPPADLHDAPPIGSDVDQLEGAEQTAGIGPPITCSAVTDAPAAEDARVFVTSVLSRFAGDPSTLEYADLPPKSGPLHVVVDNETVARALRKGLPTLHERSFRLTTRAQMQARANRLGAPVQYLRLAMLEIGQDCAHVALGVVGISPGNDGQLECCCMTYDIYERLDGAWRYRASGKVHWVYC